MKPIAMPGAGDTHLTREALDGWIFDFDGTLVESNTELWLAGLKQLLWQELELEIDLPELMLLHLSDAVDEFLRSLRPTLGRLWISKMITEHGDSPALLGGTMPLLERLKADGRFVALATARREPEPEVRGILGRLGIEHYFDAVVTGRGYPSPLGDKAHMLRDLASTHGFNPGRLAMVGDSIADVRGARRAGYGRSIGVRSGLRADTVLAAHGAHFIEDSVSTLLERVVEGGAS